MKRFQNSRVAAALLIACLGAAADAQAQKVRIRGAYSSPQSFWDSGARLNEYGINAIFVHAGSITKELLDRAKTEGADVYAEFPTLNGKGYVEKHPEAWPVNEKGERAPAATWFLGACPTEPGFRAHRMAELNKLLNQFAVAGVWMDYFHWHAQFEDPHPILPETCFNESCLRRFELDTGVRVPDGSTADKARWVLTRHERRWRSWRSSILLEWAREMRQAIEQKRPGTLLGVYHCPWNNSDYQGARFRILGLDLKGLAAVVDAFSPMVYHKRMGRPPEWVGEHLKWLCGELGVGRRSKVQVWPIVQAYNDPSPVSAAEFASVLRAGGSSGATGVMMFTIGAVAEDEKKMEVLRRVYGEW